MRTLREPAAPSRTCSWEGTSASRSSATICGYTPRGSDFRATAERSKTAGLESVPELVSVGNSTSEDAREAALELLALPRGRRPTAIFTGNNRCTVGVLHALDGDRKRIALVGFDDFELADMLGVTVVRTDPYRIGQLAAELAFARIDGDDRKPQRAVVPTELVTRGSGEIRPDAG